MTDKIREGGVKGENRGRTLIQNGSDKTPPTIISKRPQQPPPPRPKKQ